MLANKVVSKIMQRTQSMRFYRVLPPEYHAIKCPERRREAFKYLMEEKRHSEAQARKAIGCLFLGGLGAIAAAYKICSEEEPEKIKSEEATNIASKPK